MVAHLLPKQRAAGSNPVSRSIFEASGSENPPSIRRVSSFLQPSVQPKSLIPLHRAFPGCLAQKPIAWSGFHRRFGREVETKLGCLALRILHLALPIPLLIFRRADVLKRALLFQHGVDRACDFVARGHNRLLRAEACPHPTQVGSERSVTARDRLGRLPKRLRRAIDDLTGARPQHLAI